MKAALEQLSNDMTIVYTSLHFMEDYPLEDPLRPEVAHLFTLGSAALLKHLHELRAQVGRYRS